MIKLIATDMDGTFLDANGTYDKKRLNTVLKGFKKRGIVFVAASGRSLLSLESLFADFRDQMGFVAENGSALVVGGELTFEKHLTKEQYLEIIQLLLASPYMNGHEYLLSGKNGAYVHQDASSDYVNFISNYYKNIQRVDSFEAIDDVIFKLTANFTEETVLEGEKWVTERLSYANAVTTGFQSVDIILDAVTKRTGLEALCTQLGIKRDEVLAFGDNLNDYEMLEFSGTAIATGNARDEIKAISQEVIDSCEKESVMAYMEGILDDKKRH
ncbi:HAD family hydrolase [Streptococcus sciuri]|uniref:HAD family hydrolase n=1 Tax=Streptococcus sciuri TaxID=2973939 RepID=A0ABT2F774_9STRE|nr:HAD family hydrolase [Streptococcus sciuri]MCS4488331.1 HAD family hydrolase [Streptococcus sciuri]